ncbi:MAG: zf-TFIIB domain-containing protein [Betaproteobacteria bacterium]|nr:zf-TFIIB domain-containing protein [Betaproteobacteria bacterium]
MPPAPAAAVLEAGHVGCPNCAAPMQRHAFASLEVKPLEIDVCHACHAIWFDAHESARLAADGVVDLFRLIHAQGGAATARIGTKLACARCRSPLELTNDIARQNRFSYHRCPQGHGRFTSFLHFLREKQFVRDLTVGERQKLAAHVRQVKCSSCSGPIDIAQHAACTYCGAAVSVLDKEATQKALDHYLQERKRQGQPLPVAHHPAPADAHARDFDYLWFDLGTDLVGAFARLAARPAVAWSSAPVGAMADTSIHTAAAALPTLDEALTGSGLGDSLTLVPMDSAGSALGETLGSDLLASAGDAAGGLAESAGSLAEGAVESVADGGLIDLVGDGIGSIVEGLFS